VIHIQEKITTRFSEHFLYDPSQGKELQKERRNWRQQGKESKQPGEKIERIREAMKKQVMGMMMGINHINVKNTNVYILTHLGMSDLSWDGLTIAKKLLIIFWSDIHRSWYEQGSN